jgi:hypothetical protein
MVKWLKQFPGAGGAIQQLDAWNAPHQGWAQMNIQRVDLFVWPAASRCPTIPPWTKGAIINAASS